MNLDRLNIAIRPRRDWEAVDLGILMARRWWWPMFKTWCIVTLPLLLLTLVLPLAWLGLVPFLLWWLKPLFERPLLLILSQGIFGEQLTTTQVLKACPRLFLLQIVPSLTWRRFSPQRSMDLAVIQLEGLRGSQRQARLDVLHRNDDAPAKWLTFIGVHLESFFMIAIVSTLFAFVPSELQLDLYNMEFWFNSRPGLSLQSLFYYVAIATVAPFYVACGFSLYLNRRVKLEGWDIEIAFRRMLIKRDLISPIIVAGLCLFLFSTSLSPTVAVAQAETATRDAGERVVKAKQEVHEQIQSILDGEDFHQKRQQKVLRIKEQDDDDKEEKSDDNALFAALAAIGQGIASVLTAIASVAELLLWAVVIGGIIFLAVRYRALIAKLGFDHNAPKPKRYQPQTLFGMDVRKTSLPDDISASANALWQQQELRAALALLYRASLARLLEHGLPLRDGNTEQECLQLAQTRAHNIGLSGSTLTYFEQLTHAWRELAYGHRAPDNTRGQDLCAQWNQQWNGGGKEQP